MFDTLMTFKWKNVIVLTVFRLRWCNYCRVADQKICLTRSFIVFTRLWRGLSRSRCFLRGRLRFGLRRSRRAGLRRCSSGRGVRCWRRGLVRGLGIWLWSGMGAGVPVGRWPELGPKLAGIGPVLFVVRHFGRSSCRTTLRVCRDRTLGRRLYLK